MWRINRRDRRQDENGPDDEDVQVTAPAPEPSPEPVAPVIPADSPKSAPSPESSPSPESPVRPDFADEADQTLDAPDDSPSDAEDASGSLPMSALVGDTRLQDADTPSRR